MWTQTRKSPGLEPEGDMWTKTRESPGLNLEGNVWTVNIEVRGDEERGRLRGLGEGWVCIWVMWGVPSGD